MERDLGRVREVEPGWGVARPVGADQHDRAAGDALDDRGEVLLRGCVHPVEVFDDEEDRAEAAALAGHPLQRLEGAGLDRFGAQEREPVDVLPLVDPEQVEEVRRRLVRVHLDFLECEAHLLDDDGRIVGLGDGAVAPQDVEDRQVRDRHAVREATPFQVGDRLAAERAAKLVDEPGLAHARLGADPDGLAVPLHDLREQLLKLRELTIPTDVLTERARRDPLQRRATRPDADQLVGGDRLVSAAHLDDAGRLDAHVARHQPRGGLADDDRADLGALLQAGRDVRGVADGGVVRLKLVADPADDDRAGVHADAYRHLGPELLGEAGALLLEPALDPERREGGPPGVVLVRDRGAEQGHETVAHELADPAAVPLDFGLAQIEEPIDEREQPLGAETLGQAGRVHEVAEEDGDLLVLAAVRGARGQGAIGWLQRGSRGGERRGRHLGEGRAAGPTEPLAWRRGDPAGGAP